MSAIEKLLSAANECDVDKNNAEAGNPISPGVEERKEWTANHWISKIVIDNDSENTVIGFILNTGEVKSKMELINDILDFGLGVIGIRENYGMDSNYMTIGSDELRRPILEFRLFKNKSQKDLSDIYVKGCITKIDVYSDECDKVYTDDKNRSIFDNVGNINTFNSITCPGIFELFYGEKPIGSLLNKEIEEQTKLDNNETSCKFQLELDDPYYEPTCNKARDWSRKSGVRLEPELVDEDLDSRYSVLAKVDLSDGLNVIRKVEDAILVLADNHKIAFVCDYWGSVIDANDRTSKYCSCAEAKVELIRTYGYCSKWQIVLLTKRKDGHWW